MFIFSVPARCIGDDERAAFRGYTLIEVVVAMGIFSAMLVLGGMALNQGLKQHQGLVQRGLNFWDYARNIWTDKSFHSIIDYYVHTESGWFPYFQGDQEGISFVTLAPFAGDAPVAVWIRKESTEDGKKKLMYYELPVYAKSGSALENDFASGAYKQGQSVRILNDVEKIQFEFYGYDLTDEKHQWRRFFYGSQTKQLPLLVRIEYVQDGIKKMLTYAIHVNSQMKRGYAGKYEK